MKKLIRKLRRDTSGAVAMEYGTIALVLSVAIVGALTTMSTTVSSNYKCIADSMPDQTGTPD